MCSSKPKIPNQNATPPAPGAPEPTPDAPRISDRGLFLRGRGVTNMPKPDLSGLGNQTMGPAVSRLLIRPGQNTPVNPADEIARLEQANASAANRPSGSSYDRGGLIRNGRRR